MENKAQKIYFLFYKSVLCAAIVVDSVDHPKVVKAEGMNILGIVVFSIFFGIMCSKMGPAGKPLLDFFEALHVATMKLTMLVIW